jgi:hypothetical protein
MSASNKSAPDGHLMSHSHKRLFGNVFFYSADFEHHGTGPNSCCPKIGLALTFTHSGFQRLRTYRLVREYADINFAFTMKKVRRRNSACLYMPAAYPALFQCL